MNPNSDNRRLLRIELRRRRRQLKAGQQALAAQKLLLRLSRSHWLRQAQHIACYWPSDGEISPLPLITILRARGKQVYLPVLDSRENRLYFRLYRRGDKLRPNRFGIPEPPAVNPSRPVQALDLVLMPLVGFDGQGNRLGMGGGFYDRTLAGLNAQGPKLIGLAHSIQRAEGLRAAHWDVPLHQIATDTALITAARGR